MLLIQFHSVVQADQIQEEMDRLSAALKQIELHNEDMKGEIAVTRRATYATEEAVQKLEKEKKEQDFLIEKLQENLRVQSRHLQLYSAQVEAQKRETRAAQVVQLTRVDAKNLPVRLMKPN